jgi:hypothetical protein
MLTSLNEIEMTVWKAARGAGLSWGQAEEMAQAARWLADRGFAWAEPLVDCLTEVESCGGRLAVPVLHEGVWQPTRGTTSPALAGPLLSDLALEIEPEAPLHLARVSQPLVLLPFAARAASDIARGFILTCGSARFSCLVSELRVATLDMAPDLAAGDVVLSIAPGAETGMIRIDPGAPHAAVAPAAEAGLERWVHRTYVPASAESRLAGAGAGLTDND